MNNTLSNSDVLDLVGISIVSGIAVILVAINVFRRHSH